VPFSIEFAPPARLHLKALRKRDQQILLDGIAKRLENNPLAPWELRVGDFRVFYDVNSEAGIVVVLAIGWKVHNVLRIGDEEVQL